MPYVLVYPREVLAAVMWATLFLSAAVKVTASAASRGDKDIPVAGNGFSGRAASWVVWRTFAPFPQAAV